MTNFAPVMFQIVWAAYQGRSRRSSRLVGRLRGVLLRRLLLAQEIDGLSSEERALWKHPTVRWFEWWR